MRLKDAIAARVNELRDNEKLSVHGFSLKVGIPNSTLVDIVKARNESIQIKFIYSICAGLDISLTEFFNSPYFDKATLID